MTAEEAKDLRASISATNRKLRSDISHNKTIIKELEKRIEAERWDILRINALINENTEKFIQAGKQLNQ